MNVFEFLLVIVSILLGLGITELLAGFVRILRGELVAAVIFPSAGSAESLDTHLMRRRRPFFLLLTGYVLIAGLFSWLLFDDDLTLAWFTYVFTFVVGAAPTAA